MIKIDKCAKNSCCCDKQCSNWLVENVDYASRFYQLSIKFSPRWRSWSVELEAESICYLDTKLIRYQPIS